MNNPTTEEIKILKESFGAYQNIHIITDILYRHEMDELMACCDCFISLHRSEGFGLGMTEAMALGTLVLATDWSGNHDFMNPKNAACIDYTLTTLTQDYGPYKKGNTWAEPDINQAAQWMKILFEREKTNENQAMREQARQTIINNYSAATVGQLIRQRLEDIERL